MATETPETQRQTPPAADSQPNAEKAALEDYFFPTYGITIAAASLEEAQQKLQAQLKTK